MCKTLLSQSLRGHPWPRSVNHRLGCLPAGDPGAGRPTSQGVAAQSSMIDQDIALLSLSAAAPIGISRCEFDSMNGTGQGGARRLQRAGASGMPDGSGP